MQECQNDFSHDACQLQKQECGKEIQDGDKHEKRHDSQCAVAVCHYKLEERDVADDRKKYIIGGNENATAYELILF